MDREKIEFVARELAAMVAETNREQVADKLARLLATVYNLGRLDAFAESIRTEQQGLKSVLESERLNWHRKVESGE
ncbi:MAG: hypothetical protein NZM12_11710 [Steroidobacteraceae bacterium]|nr:hypothetical protein [Steroidobacteraceae bacterium]